MALLLVGGGLFVAGTKFSGGPKGFQNLGSEDRQARIQQFSGEMGGGMMRGARVDGGGVTGEIISRDDKSMTVKLSDGGSKIIFYSSETAITKSVSGTVNGLTVGEQVMVLGTANDDGSVTAQSIQIRLAEVRVPRGSAPTQ